MGVVIDVVVVVVVFNVVFTVVTVVGLAKLLLVFGLPVVIIGSSLSNVG